MNYSIALTRPELIYMTGTTTNEPPSGPLPRDLNDIMVRLVHGWNDNVDAFKALSNAVYEFCEADGEAYLREIVEYAKRWDVDPDIIKRAVKNGRDRSDSSQHPAVPTNENNRETAASNNGASPQKINVDIREGGAAVKASKSKAKPKREQATKTKTKTEITPFLSVPTSAPYSQDQKEYFAWQFAGDAALTPTRRLIGICLSMHLNKTNGQLNPSLATLAKESGSKKSTVIEALKAFATRGHVRVIKPGRAGAGHSTEFGFNLCVEKGPLAQDLFDKGQRLWESDQKRSRSSGPFDETKKVLSDNEKGPSRLKKGPKL